MYLGEALMALRQGLSSLCVLMESVRQEQIEKVAGDYLPMQDHLAECTYASTPQLEWSVEESLEYLGRLYKGLKESFDHGQLAAKKGLDWEFEVAIIADMLWGSIYNNYPDYLLACAREVWEKVQKMPPPKVKITDKKRLKWQRAVMKEVAKICDKHGVDLPIGGEWTIQEGYMMEWLLKQYFEGMKE